MAKKAPMNIQEIRLYNMVDKRHTPMFFPRLKQRMKTHDKI